MKVFNDFGGDLYIFMKGKKRMFKDFIEKNKSIYEKDAYEVVINKYIEEIILMQAFKT